MDATRLNKLRCGTHFRWRELYWIGVIIAGSPFIVALGVVIGIALLIDLYVAAASEEETGRFFPVATDAQQRSYGK